MNAMMTVFVILVLVAFVVTVMSMMGRAPIGVAVLVLCIIELLRVLPLGK